MAEKKHVIEYIDIIKSFEKVKEKLKNKSDKGHQHGNADITDIDASKIKSGTIDIDRLPKGAIERMVYVKDDAARFALTTNTAQNGDTVKVRSTKKMFYVIDDTKLSSEAGYEPYTAESASAVPWSGVTGKPTTFTPEAHAHAISEVADLQETLTRLRQDVNAKPSKDTNTTYSLIQDSTDGHKLTFKGSDGSTKTVTIPDNDHNDNTWRDVVDGLDSTRTDASLSANQGRILNGKFGGYLPLHGTADIAASVVDYGDTAKHIQVGFSGAGITGDNIKYIAGYTGGDGGNLSAKIKDISKDALKSWLGLGSLAYSSASIPTSLPASDVYAWAKASSKPSYSWGEISGRPTALSSFTNDSGFITGSDSRLTNARPASDVYSWAKASSKPSYSWTEISNRPDIPSISKDTPTRTNWTISSEYNCVVYRIGDFCLAVVTVTGSLYPRQWLPAAKLPSDYAPKKQSRTFISPAIITKGDDYIMGIGSPGANSIPQVLAQVINANLRNGIDLEDAVEMNRFLFDEENEVLSEKMISPEIISQIIDDGNNYSVVQDKSKLLYGSIHAIVKDRNEGIYGISDSRRRGEYKVKY